MINRVEPHNIEAEQAVLSAILNNPSCRPKAKKALKKDDFYTSVHQLLFSVISANSHDLAGVVIQLHEKGLLKQIGGKDYLIDLANMMSTSAAIDHYIGAVKEASKKRKLFELSMKIMDNAERSTSREMAAVLRDGLQSLDLRDRFGFRSVPDIANVYTPERMLAAYEEYIKTLKHNRFITGIHEIDKRIRGVAGGEVLFVIARAGTFKTAFLQNFLKNYVRHSSWASLFFSIEMPVASVAERYHEIIHGSTGKDIEKIYTAAHDQTSHVKSALEMNFVEQLKNVFVVPTKVSIRDIATYVNIIEEQFQKTVGLIGIDYLGLMEGKGQGEYEIVSKLARDCKGLAKLLDLPVIVVSQTSRRAGSGDVEISLDMGRGSGAIEESADFVLGLFQVERDRLSVEDDGPEYDLICKILKNRKGPKGSRWRLDLDPTNLRIGPDAELWEPRKSSKRGYDG